MGGRSGHNAPSLAEQVLCLRANLQPIRTRLAGRSGHSATNLVRQVFCLRANFTAGRSGHNATNHMWHWMLNNGQYLASKVSSVGIYVHFIASLEDCMGR